MGHREVRPVPLDWQHPREPGTYSDGSPRYRPLFSRRDYLRDLEYNADCPLDELSDIDPVDYMPEMREGVSYVTLPAVRDHQRGHAGLACLPVAARTGRMVRGRGHRVRQPQVDAGSVARLIWKPVRSALTPSCGSGRADRPPPGSEEE